MAKILDFARYALGGSAAPAAVIGHTVAASLNDGASRAGVLADSLVDGSNVGDLLRSDWTNQELADLYRVKHILDKAGAAVDVDRGLSDEGDPWFVFCQDDGEVFVHLARIDGQYLLDSPNISEPLHGANFSELIGAFVRRANLMRARAGNVVSLRPGDSLLLHPAVMLTALIWSLYIASDDLVGVAHAHEDGAGHDGPGAGPEFAGYSLVDAVVAGEKLQAELSGDAPLAKPLANAPAKAAEQGNPAGNGAQQAAALSIGAAQAVAASLTAIVGAYGLDKLGLVPMFFDGVEGRGPAAHAEPEGKTEVAAVRAAEHDGSIRFAALDHAFVAEGDSSALSAAAIADQVKLAAKAAASVAAANVTGVASVHLPAESAQATPVNDDKPAVDKQKAMVEAKTEAVPNAAAKAQATATHAEQATTKDVASAVETVEAHAGSSDASSTTAGLIASASGSVIVYSLGGQTVVASVDLKEVASLKITSSSDNGYRNVGDLLVGASEAGKPAVVTHADMAGAQGSLQPAQAVEDPISVLVASLPKYDAKARDFLNFLLGGDHHLNFIATANEVVLIDMTAFDNPGDQSYARSWVFDDNSIVSTVGNLQDFQAFGLA